MKKTGLLKTLILVAACGNTLAATTDKATPQDAPPDSAQEQATMTPSPPAIPPERSETIRGQQLQQQIENTDTQTKVSWLGVKPDQFLALYRADSSGKTYANLILLHDNQQHPDWPGLVHQIRIKLTRHGWNTLSVAVPVIPVGQILPALKPDVATPLPATDTELKPSKKTAKETPEPVTASAETKADEPIESVEYPAAEVPEILAQRVQDAVQFMRAQSPLPVFVAALGSSATLLEQQGQVVMSNGISAVVIIDPSPLPNQEGLDRSAPAIRSIALPVLDLVPALNAHSDPLPRKQEATQLQRENYQQRIIPGATTGFIQFEDVVIKAIRGWGKRLLAGD